MQDIMLTIIGRQFAGDEAEDRMEFVTEGKLYRRGEATYLVYDESEFSGFPGCKTSLRVKGDTMRMKRIGADSLRRDGYGGVHHAGEECFVRGGHRQRGGGLRREHRRHGRRKERTSNRSEITGRQFMWDKKNKKRQKRIAQAIVIVVAASMVLTTLFWAFQAIV